MADRYEQPPAAIVDNLTDHYWVGDAGGHNCATCVERDDTLRMCWPQVHCCAVCEGVPCDWPDVLCASCRSSFERSSDTLTDPVELALGGHQRAVVSDSDHQVCTCGWVIDGGPALHRRHQAAVVYAALGIDGPEPWIIGPESEMREPMEAAGRLDNGSSTGSRRP